MRVDHDDVEDDQNRPLIIIDSKHGLTTDELAELKQLAALSKMSRLAVGILFGFITLIGLPTIIELLAKSYFNHRQ